MSAARLRVGQQKPREMLIRQIIDTFMERFEIALTRLSIDLTPLESGQHAFKSIYRNKRGGA